MTLRFETDIFVPRSAPIEEPTTEEMMVTTPGEGGGQNCLFLYLKMIQKESFFIIMRVTSYSTSQQPRTHQAAPLTNGHHYSKYHI